MRDDDAGSTAAEKSTFAGFLSNLGNATEESQIYREGSERYYELLEGVENQFF
jgi:hypothetical protein